MIHRPSSALPRGERRPRRARACRSTARGAERPHGDLLQADDPGCVRGDELDHLAQVAAALGRHGVAVKEIPRANQDRHARSLRSEMRIVLTDPPAFTPTYDHELAAALARAGVDVTLVTSHFRFGEVAGSADGYVRRELFYPLSSRLFQRSRAATAAQGRRASGRPRSTAGAARGCASSPVARTGDRRALASGRMRRPCSLRMTSCRGGRRGSRTSGAGCFSASTVSSCTARAGVRHLRRSAWTLASSLTPSFRATRSVATMGAQCSRSASSARTRVSAMQSRRCDAWETFA